MGQYTDDFLAVGASLRKAVVIVGPSLHGGDELQSGTVVWTQLTLTLQFVVRRQLADLHPRSHQTIESLQLLIIGHLETRSHVV